MNCLLRCSKLNGCVYFYNGEGNGNPLQCSCLENPRDGGAWWAAVYGVIQSRTRLKWLSSSSSILNLQVNDVRTVSTKEGEQDGLMLEVRRVNRMRHSTDTLGCWPSQEHQLPAPSVPHRTQHQAGTWLQLCLLRTSVSPLSAKLCLCFWKYCLGWS